VAAAGCGQLDGQGVEGTGQDDRLAAEPDAHLAVCGLDVAEREAAGYRSQIAKKKAIIVVGHALIVIIWHILATGKPCEEPGAGYLTSRLDPERETRRLIAKLEAPGHTVTLEPAAA
jgi:hypothetical protein